ncbi:hypothetical protein B0H13DRAFT_1877185 [Mycena leptocephala]|nr:hypothetical protein B0H13DRAFT_1877185 [Mycena leptocephala]
MTINDLTIIRNNMWIIRMRGNAHGGNNGAEIDVSRTSPCPQGQQGKHLARGTQQRPRHYTIVTGRVLGIPWPRARLSRGMRGVTRRVGAGKTPARVAARVWWHFGSVVIVLGDWGCRSKEAAAVDQTDGSQTKRRQSSEKFKICDGCEERRDSRSGTGSEGRENGLRYLYYESKAVHGFDESIWFVRQHGMGIKSA